MGVELIYLAAISLITALMWVPYVTNMILVRGLVLVTSCGSLLVLSYSLQLLLVSQSLKLLNCQTLLWLQVLKVLFLVTSRELTRSLTAWAFLFFATT